MGVKGISYVVPLRCDGDCDRHEDLAIALDQLRNGGVDVIVSDGSPLLVLEGAHRPAFAGLRHLIVQPRSGVNGKVTGVRAGVMASLHERIVIADDDVRYDLPTLLEVASLLDEADLAVPQNHFEGPACWHTIWDTGRTLLNRALGHDYPGTIAVRRSMFARTDGYDDDVLFENLELIRTVRAAGGRIRWAPDVYVPRAQPTTAAFLSQRVRHAYDDLAQPFRLLTELSIGPVLIWTIARKPRALLFEIFGVIAVAEVGRRRHGGAGRFPFVAVIAAPAWALERAFCVWIAVALRVLRGGVRYRGGRLRRAASSPRDLRRRLRPSTRMSLPRASRRIGVSFASGHIGRAGSPVDEPLSSGRPRRRVLQVPERAADHLGTP